MHSNESQRATHYSPSVLKILYTTGTKATANIPIIFFTGIYLSILNHFRGTRTTVYGSWSWSTEPVPFVCFFNRSVDQAQKEARIKFPFSLNQSPERPTRSCFPFPITLHTPDDEFLLPLSMTTNKSRKSEITASSQKHPPKSIPTCPQRNSNRTWRIGHTLRH